MCSFLHFSFLLEALIAGGSLLEPAMEDERRANGSYEALTAALRHLGEMESQRLRDDKPLSAIVAFQRDNCWLGPLQFQSNISYSARCTAAADPLEASLRKTLRRSVRKQKVSSFVQLQRFPWRWLTHTETSHHPSPTQCVSVAPGYQS